MRTNTSLRASGFPFACWWHHPLADRTAAGLASATLATQARHDCDLVKMSPPGTYQAMDLGGVDAWCGNRRGYGAIAHRPLQTPMDWERLAESATTGAIVAEAMAAIPIVRRDLPEPRPILQTVFSPIAVAEHLAGAAAFNAMLRDRPKPVHRLLDRLTRCAIDAIEAARLSGASGIFYVIQQMRRDVFAARDYAPLYRSFDARCIEAMATSPINLVHVHGSCIHLPFEPLPPSCWLHWEWNRSNPSLRRLRALGSPLAIGVPAALFAATDGPESIAAYLKTIERDLGGHPAMLTPGCTLPFDLPPAHLDRWSGAARAKPVAALPIAATPAAPRGVEPSPPEASIAEACRDILRPGAPATARLAMIQRLEQDLRRALPLSLAGFEDSDARHWIDRVAACPPTPLPPSPREPRLSLLLEPGTPMLDAMGLVRSLRGIADTRLLYLDPHHWLLPPAAARAAVRQSLFDQVAPDQAPAILVGLGTMGPVVAWLGEQFAAEGRPPALVLHIAVAPSTPAPTPARGLRTLPRNAWLAWARRSRTAGRADKVETFARATGRLLGWHAERTLRGSAAHDAQRHGLTSLRPRHVAALRFPENGSLPRAALNDPAMLEDLAAMITAIIPSPPAGI